MRWELFASYGMLSLVSPPSPFAPIHSLRPCYIDRARTYLILTISSSLTILVNRRDRRSFLGSKKNSSERLRKLDKVSPTCTLEKWWTATKGNLGLSEAVDGQFVWYVYLASPAVQWLTFCSAPFVWSK